MSRGPPRKYPPDASSFVDYRVSTIKAPRVCLAALRSLTREDEGGGETAAAVEKRRDRKQGKIPQPGIENAVCEIIARLRASVRASFPRQARFIIPRSKFLHRARSMYDSRHGGISGTVNADIAILRDHPTPFRFISCARRYIARPCR